MRRPPRTALGEWGPLVALFIVAGVLLALALGWR
jgi:hypothetical protein